MDDVSKQIYLATSFLSHEKVKLALESMTAKYVTQFAKVVHNAAALMGISGSLENKIDYTELIAPKDQFVLCFDDLERCKVDIVEILGYINNFVEHDDAKIIIVGNEGEIKDKDIGLEQNNELKILASALSLGFEKCINDVVAKVKNGEYDIRNYYQIFSMFEDFNGHGLLKRKMDELFSIFELGIHKSEILGQQSYHGHYGRKPNGKESVAIALKLFRVN